MGYFVLVSDGPMTPQDLHGIPQAAARLGLELLYTHTPEGYPDGSVRIDRKLLDLIIKAQFADDQQQIGYVVEIFNRLEALGVNLGNGNAQFYMYDPANDELLQRLFAERARRSH